MVNRFWISYLWFFILSAILSTTLAGRNPSACYQWMKLVRDVVQQQRRTMSIPLYNQNNRIYLGDVTIGLKQEQTIKVLFDTCSQPLLVTSKSSVQGNSDRFEFFEESYVTKEEQRDVGFLQEFADGSIYEGPWISTVVKIGGPKSQVKDRVRVALALERKATVIPLPGIFGLAFKSEFQSIISKSALTAKFSVYYKRETTIGLYQESGELYIGGYNLKYMDTGFLTTVKVVEKKGDGPFFYFVMNWIRVRSETISLEKQDTDGRDVSPLAVLDTGANIFRLPSEIYEELMSRILDGQTSEQPPRHKWFPCEELPDDLPQIEFNVNDFILEIGPENYITTMDYDGYLCLCRFLLKLNTENEIQLGAGFFHRYYTMFDYAKKEIKLAKAKQPMVMDEHKQPGKYGSKCRKHVAQSDIEELLKRSNEILRG